MVLKKKSKLKPEVKPLELPKRPSSYADPQYGKGLNLRKNLKTLGLKRSPGRPLSGSEYRVNVPVGFNPDILKMVNAAALKSKLNRSRWIEKAVEDFLKKG